MTKFLTTYTTLYEHEEALQTAEERLRLVFESLEKPAKLQVHLTAEAAIAHKLQAHAKFSAFVAVDNLSNFIYRFKTTDTWGEIKVSVHERYLGNETWVLSFVLSPDIVVGNIPEFNIKLDNEIKGIVGQRKSANAQSIQKQIEEHQKRLAELEQELQGLKAKDD